MYAAARVVYESGILRDNDADIGKMLGMAAVGNLVCCTRGQ